MPSWFNWRNGSGQDFIILRCIFTIISPWKKERPFIWTNMKPVYPRMLCAKFSWNWSSGSGENFQISSIYYHYFVIISPWKRTEPFSYRLESPSSKDALCHVKLKLAQWFWRRFFNFINIFSFFSLSSPFLNGNVSFIWINLNPLHPKMLCAILGWKDQCLKDLAKKSEKLKIKILTIAWSECTSML